jgi:tetratricopeptide (TPR) repeat protein
MIRRISFCAVLLVATPAIAQSTSQPTSVDPTKAALAEQLYQAARSMTKPEEAMAAAEKALSYDPGNCGANLLLAELLLDKNVAKALEQFAKAEDLAKARPDLPADLTARLTAMRQRIARLRQSGAAWTGLRSDYARRYTLVAEAQATFGLPSTALAFRRASALNPDDAQLQTQCNGAEAGLAKLPTPADSPDPAAAAMLHTQGHKLLSDGRWAQAVEVLRNAVSLDPNLADPWVDLASACQQQKNLPAAAACALQAREKLAGDKDPEAAKKLEPRIKLLLDQADPKLRQLDELDKQFVAAANRLADQAMAVGERGVALAVEETLKGMALGGGNPSGPGGIPAPSLPGNLAGKIDFTSKAVELKDHTYGGPGASIRPFRNGILFEPLPGRRYKPGEGCTVEVVLGKLTFGSDSRIRWRIEVTKPPELYTLHVCFWPFTEAFGSNCPYISVYGRGKSVCVHPSLPDLLKANHSELTVAAAADQAKAFDPGGVYDITCVKLRNRVTIWVNSTKVLEATLSPEHVQKVAKLPVRMVLGSGSGEVPIKATLTELFLGPNVPAFLPTSQPSEADAEKSGHR